MVSKRILDILFRAANDQNAEPGRQLRQSARQQLQELRAVSPPSALINSIKHNEKWAFVFQLVVQFLILASAAQQPGKLVAQR